MLIECDGICGQQARVGEPAKGWSPYLVRGEIRHVCERDECKAKARDEYRAEQWRRKEAER